jgi:hypothetical protein
LAGLAAEHARSAAVVVENRGKRATTGWFEQLSAEDLAFIDKANDLWLNSNFACTSFAAAGSEGDNYADDETAHGEAECDA